MLGVVEQAFQQQGHQQLSVQPSTATVLPPLRHSTQSEDRFQPLEIQRVDRKLSRWALVRIDYPSWYSLSWGRDSHALPLAC